MKKIKKLEKLNKKKIVLFKELFEAEEPQDIKKINTEISVLERRIKKLG